MAAVWMQTEMLRSEWMSSALMNSEFCTSLSFAACAMRKGVQNNNRTRLNTQSPPTKYSSGFSSSATFDFIGQDVHRHRLARECGLRSFQRTGKRLSVFGRSDCLSLYSTPVRRSASYFNATSLFDMFRLRSDERNAFAA